MEVNDASPNELYQTLGSLLTSTYSQNWQQTWKDYREAEQKQAYYFSIEFLPGKMLKSNLLNMGWLEMVTEALAELGIDLEDLAEVEPDMALGNGGLGRLALVLWIQSPQWACLVTETGFVTSTVFSNSVLWTIIRLNCRTNGYKREIFGKSVKRAKR
jgi:hypothetical protein